MPTKPGKGKAAAKAAAPVAAAKPAAAKQTAIVVPSQEAAASQPSTSGSGYPSAVDVKLPGWRAEQVRKAATSLLKFIGQQQESRNDLFEDEEMLHLLIALKKMPVAKRQDKPLRLPIPHPLFSTANQSICLFVKDHQGEGHKDAKKKLATLEKNGGVAKVVGLSKLRTKYESHEAKRQLCKSFDLFMADDRIIPSLPKLLGKSFFKKKKQPIPVDLSRPNWQAAVANACKATYLYNQGGTCLSIKVARSTFEAQEIVDNVNAALVAAVEKLPKKWANVQGVFLKSADSVALPLFQTTPDAKLIIDAGKQDDS